MNMWMNTLLSMVTSLRKWWQNGYLNIRLRYDMACLHKDLAWESILTHFGEGLPKNRKTVTNQLLELRWKIFAKIWFVDDLWANQQWDLIWGVRSRLPLLKFGEKNPTVSPQ